MSHRPGSIHLLFIPFALITALAIFLLPYLKQTYSQDIPVLPQPSSPTSTPTPTPSPLPQGFKSTTIPSISTTTCLPTPWQVGSQLSPHSVEIHSPHSSGSLVRATFISSYPITNSDIVQSYLSQKLSSDIDTTLSSKAKITSITIANQLVYKVKLPAFPEVIVFSTPNRLFAIGSDHPPLTDTSTTEFNHILSTIISCTQSI